MNKMRYLRIGIASAVLIVIFALTFAHVPIGTLCALCPVGFAEIWAASGSAPLGLLPGVLIVLGVVFVLGRVFCSWICPTSWLRNIFGGKKPHGLTGQTGEMSDAQKAAQAAGDNEVTAQAEAASEGIPVEEGAQEGGAKACGSCTACSAIGNPNTVRERNNILAQGIVLAVLLIISFIVHFPVFCLFCPIGLVFGTMFAISRTFVTWQPGWELIVFPVMLALELFVLRKWCSAICPLGFFFGLMAKARSRIKALPRVRVDQGSCIHKEGCEVCTTVCSEDICAATSDAHDQEDCTLCGDCWEHCPTRSIKL